MNKFYQDLINLKKEYNLDRIEIDLENHVGYDSIVMQITYNTMKYSIWFDGLGGFNTEEMAERTKEFIEESILDAIEKGYEK